MGKEIEEIFNLYWKELRKLPNVLGFCEELQPKIHKDQSYPEILAFIVYVEKKVPLKDLALKDCIPFSFILSDGREIFTDVLEINIY